MQACKAVWLFSEVFHGFFNSSEQMLVVRLYKCIIEGKFWHSPYHYQFFFRNHLVIYCFTSPL